jgi:hypothetical protein
MEEAIENNETWLASIEGVKLFRSNFIRVSMSGVRQVSLRSRDISR